MNAVSERTARKAKVPASVPFEPRLKARLAADPELAQLYLQAAMEEASKADDPGIFQVALKDVADARGGVASLARRTGLNRTHLYRMMSKDGNPTVSALWVMLRAFGLGFSVRTRESIEPLSSHAGRARMRRKPA